MRNNRRREKRKMDDRRERKGEQHDVIRMMTYVFSYTSPSESDVVYHIAESKEEKKIRRQEKKKT
jgi:hypothetical protein